MKRSTARIATSRGAFRRAVLVGGLAFKFPRLRMFRAGRQCNLWEREMWRHWRPRFQWNSLCPVLFADPFGIVVVMPRVEPLGTEEEPADYYPSITAELKADDHGWLCGVVVTVDYGIDDSQEVEKTRRYYAGFTGPAVLIPPSA